MIEKILSELRELPHGKYTDDYGKGFSAGINAAISIVQEVAKEYGEKKLYSIDLEGCDDDTSFEMELTTQEYGLLERVSKLANETSTYGCMPRMYVTEIAPYQKGE